MIGEKRAASEQVNQRAEERLGARIRAARLARRLTQAQLAQALGVSKQQMWKYEHGEDRLSVVRFVEIAQALGVTPSFLVEHFDGKDRISENAPQQPEILDIYGELGSHNRDLLLTIGRSVVEATKIGRFLNRSSARSKFLQVDPQIAVELSDGYE